VKPTLSELEKFEEAPEGMQLDVSGLTSKSSAAASHRFATGDVVEVAEGELIHLQGTVINVEGNNITIQPKHADLKVRIET
jgi:transcription elongation factor SPT5